MSDHEDHKSESLMEKISEKVHAHKDDSSSSSSSSDSDDDNKISAMKDKVFRLFGREKPVQHVFGGGKRMLNPNSITLLRQFIACC